MKTVMLGLLAETSIHPGAGRSMGVVDLPVAREAATHYPVLVGSSLKGALRDKAGSGPDASTADIETHFGKPDHAGGLLVGDGRLLLLPVRSLTESFRWVTCPHLVARYRRDLKRAGLGSRLPTVPEVERGTALANGTNGHLFLEEREFKVAGKVTGALAEAIAPLILHDDTRGMLESGIAVLNDRDFAWFASYGLPIQARNVLEDGTKRSRNLWYEESLPPDTVMYALVAARDEAAFSFAGTLFPADDPYLQAGGNETVGQGWFAVTAGENGGGGE